jgi:hypothetical protein
MNLSRSPLVRALAAALTIAACRGGAAVPDGGSAATGGAGGAGAGGASAGGAGGAVDAGTPDAADGGCATADAGASDAGTGCDGIGGGAGYAAEVAPIFAQSCNGELCHLAPTRSSLVGVTASECCDGRLLVAPGDAAQSYLVDKIRGHDLCSGGQMPLGQAPLTDAEQLAIVRWICAGALDD